MSLPVEDANVNCVRVDLLGRLPDGGGALRVRGGVGPDQEARGALLDGDHSRPFDDGRLVHAEDSDGEGDAARLVVAAAGCRRDVVGVVPVAVGGAIVVGGGREREFAGLVDDEVATVGPLQPPRVGEVGIVLRVTCREYGEPGVVVVIILAHAERVAVHEDVVDVLRKRDVRRLVHVEDVDGHCVRGVVIHVQRVVDGA